MPRKPEPDCVASATERVAPARASWTFAAGMRSSRAELEQPCVKPRGHGGMCASESFWCVKHDITRLYPGRPCVDCLTETLNRHGLAIGKAEVKSEEVVDRFPLRVARAGFVRLTDEIGEVLALQWRGGRLYSV